MPWDIEVTDVYDAWFDCQSHDAQDAILAHLKALAVEGNGVAIALFLSRD